MVVTESNSIGMDRQRNHLNGKAEYADQPRDTGIAKQFAEKILTKPHVSAVICSLELLEALAERYPKTGISTDQRGYIGRIYSVPFYVDERFDTTYIIHAKS